MGTLRKTAGLGAATKPLLTAKEPDAGYVAQHVNRLRELTLMRRIAELKSRLQRTNPVEQVIHLACVVAGLTHRRHAKAHITKLGQG